MNIIIVGPDGAGKSTLAADLSKRLMMPVFHGHGTDDDKIARWEYMAQNMTHVIFDRAYYIDDQVYSSIVGVDPETWEPHDEFISGSLLIYWDNALAQAYVQSFGDEYIKADMIGDIRDNYTSYFASHTKQPDLVFTEVGYDNYESNVNLIVNTYRNITKARDY